MFCLISGFGIGGSIAHVDFYPNGGEDQLGCDNEAGQHLFTLINADMERKLSYFAFYRLKRLMKWL